MPCPYRPLDPAELESSMSVVNNMTIKLGGEAGMGVASNGAGLTKALARAGLHVVSVEDYMSRIRGGHNFFQIRASEKPIYSHTAPVHLLLAFTQEAVEIHSGEIVPGGGVIVDEEIQFDEKPLLDRGVKIFRMPLAGIAKDVGGNKLMMNTAAIGAAAGVTQLDIQYISEVIEENFGRRKGAPIAEANLKVARAAYDMAAERYGAEFEFRLQARDLPRRMVINGNEAFCLGALAAGCKLVAGYPMTPTSSIIEWMAQQGDRYGVVVRQTEDEIAGILTVIGAAHAGVRAMTATSGGGFCLMVEALGMAGMTETPIVVVEGQRAGPSTGLPTRTEQGDLEFVMHAAQGEFPRIVLAPATHEQCFEIGVRAFNLAERYQCPVIVLTDLNLARAMRDVPPEVFDIENAQIDRGELLTYEDLDKLTAPYLRHAYTDTGISPRAIPGHPKAVFMTDSDEHGPQGHIIEDAETRTAMMNKRMKKLELAKQDMNGPMLYGPKEADVTLMGWGSTYGALREAVDMLHERGTSANLVHFTDLWPVNEERVAAHLESARRLVAVENNYSAQWANVVRRCTGVSANGKVVKYDGRPFSPEDVLAGLEKGVRSHV
jgi:2-oxoglutarate ferredoxin oxidoreductase subunit alpha